MLLKKLSQSVLTGAFVFYSLFSDVALANSINQAPDCSSAIASETLLWPANHKFQNINIIGVTDPNEDDVSISVRCIKQDEPLNSTGDGNFSYDASGVGTSKAKVRKERKGNSNGRFYHIFFTASDTHGASCAGEVTVAVPKSKKKTPIDEGALYDSVPNNNDNCGIEITNVTPTAENQSIEVDEDSNLPITLSGSDSDGDALTYSLVGDPSNGTLTGDAPNFVYTPTLNYNGNDTFTFKVNDGQVDSNTATIFITVNPVNDVPVIQDQSVEVEEDGSLPITLGGSDTDGDALIYSLISVPSNGTLTGDAPNFVYTPMPNYYGNDIFTFKVNDGQADSNTATISIIVSPINDTPIAQDQSLTVDEDSSLSITLNGVDSDGDSLTYSVLTNPINGTLSGIAPNLSYTPVDNFHGTDSLTFKVNDGISDSETATITLIVNSINDMPTVDAGSDQIVTEGIIVTLNAIANDIDGTIVSAVWTEAGQTLGNELILSTSDLSQGAHELTISVTDNDGGTASDTVSVIVNAIPNNPPIAIPQSIQTSEDTAKEIVIFGTDEDGDTLTYLVTSNPSNGVVSGTAPNIIYTPNNDYAGADSFKFAVNDGSVYSSEATINITVEGVNDAPIVNAGIDKTYILGEPVTLQALATDSDGSIESYEWKEDAYVVGSAQGLVLTNLVLGEHIFNVTVIDDGGLTATDNVKITIQEDQVLLGSLTGTTIDKRGVVIPNAKVSLSTGEQVVSNNRGEYSIENILPVERTTVTASKNFFLRNSEIVNIKAGKETAQDIVLSRPDSVTTIDTTVETVIETSGMTVTLPSGGYTDTLGNPVESEISLSASYFPITTEEGINEFPGDTLAENEEGEIGDLVSFGFVKLELNDDLGNEVLIPQGEQIELSIPADDSLEKPATIPFWSFDEDKGLWVDEGIAVYDASSNTYRIPVTKVATFNLDAYLDVIASIELCIEDTQGNKVQGYVGIGPVDRSWRRMAKTNDVGLLRLESIIGERSFNIYAGSVNGHIGEYALNPLYIQAGENKPSECIIVSDSSQSKALNVTGSMVDEFGNGVSNSEITIFGLAEGQVFGNPGLVELTRIQSGESGEFIFDLEKNDPTALEVGMFGDKKVVLQVINDGGFKEKIEFTLEKDQANYGIGNILIPPHINLPPVAHAGTDITIYRDELFSLNASKSYDPDNIIANYEWRIGDTIIGSGVQFTLSSIASIGIELGKHNVTLTVTDEHGLKASDDMFINVIDRPNHELFADAGLDRTIYLNETIVIQGESLSVGSAIYYKWSEGDTILLEGNIGSGKRLFFTGTELGEHTIKLTVTNSHGLEKVDEVKVSVVEPKHFLNADAGVDKVYYVGEAISIKASIRSINSDISSIQWLENGEVIRQWVTGDVVTQFRDYIFYSSQQPGVHNLTLVVKNEHGLIHSDDLVITILEEKPERVDEDIFVSMGVSYTYPNYWHLSRTFYNSPGTYTQYTKWEDNGVQFSTQSNPTYHITNKSGIHTIKVTVTNQNGLSASDQITVNLDKQLGRVHADAGKDVAIYLGSSVNISTNNSFSNHANGLDYSWSENGNELSTSDEFNYRPKQLGAHTLLLTVTDKNGLSATDEMIVTVTEKRDNKIYADAGKDQSGYLNSDIEIGRGNESYSLNRRTQLRYLWTEGDTELSTSKYFTHQFSQEGIHTIKLTVSDPDGLIDTDEMIVKVQGELDTINPVITLNGEENITILQSSNYTELGATAIDNRDGVITESIVMTNPLLTTYVVGNHIITYTVKDIAGNEASITRRVNIVPPGGDIQAPVITLIGENPVTLIEGADYNDQGATVFDNVDGPIGYSFDSTVNTRIPGEYRVVYTATDQAGNTSSASRIVVIEPQSNIAPTVVISNPPPYEVTSITQPFDIVGSVMDDNLESWKLMYREKGLILSSDFVVLAQGTSNVTEQVLATLDPTQLLNGIYEVVLRATDTDGLRTDEFVSVSIDGDLKVGNFSISFEDLSIPTAGIPLSITRTYDTRQRHKNLDFGQGWSLGYENIRIQENRTPGFGWDVISYQSGPQGLIPNLCIETNNDNIVTVTMAGGEVKKFQAKTEPACNQVVPIFDVNIVFEAIGDDNGAKLEALDNNFGRLVDGSIYVVGEGVVDPTRYKLTTKEGREFTIDQTEGIREIYEPEGGNRVTITQAGIVHSAGPSIDFERDAQDRITKIITSEGRFVKYSYDENGDLITFTNRADETTSFSYLDNVNLPHYLEDITDPRGIRVARNEYDENGRLSAHIDADGNRIEYTHDISGRIETVKNRLGHSTTYVYNDRGNVLAETNALGETITHGYDQYGNQLSTTDALGNTQSQTIDNIGNVLSETDALGNTSSSTYGVFNQFNTQTDALGRAVISNYYDNFKVLGVPILPGPLTRITDALGNRISLGYTNAGVNSITDTLGNITRTEYNSSGFITASIDALGVRTDYTVDSMGNRLTETTTRTNAAGAIETLTTTHVYDAKDNLIQTTDALGNVTRMEYNSINKMSAEIDANGNRTEYEYDSRGNKSKMTYADGSTATMTYDAENNKLSETDRLGRTTTYVYDKVNRLIETILPDATSGYLTDNPRTKTEYDGAGRVSAAIDANGNRTIYGYDAAGRRTSVTDALGNISTYTYDSVGNQTSFTDANGNTMSYEYDVLDRRTKTTYADGTSMQVAYDALGRKTSSTDQAGVVTQYAYDALGRLLKVTDAQNNETSYTYDEQGNKISQTDAEGRITKWAYDKLGRIISRTLPLGQIETSSYDAVGNMTSKTDFNGQTASMVYDVNNRLVKSTYADGQIDEITYDAVGNRTQAKQSKSGGVSLTAYVFDAQNRLTQETQADDSILNYQYDNQGNRTQLKTTKGTDVTTVNYTFDELNRLATVNDAQGLTTYAYDAVGNRSQITHSNGNMDNYVYDTLNRLTNLNHQNSANAVLSSFIYTLGVTGKRTKISEANGRITDYTYDNLYRLKTETITDATNGNYSASYDYDKVGNRTYETKDGVQTQYTYDGNDRLSQQGGTTYTYDSNGSILTETLDGNSKTYSYNAKNQLIETSNAGATTSYQYNSDGIRIAQMSGIETTQYVVDTNRAYAQVVQELVDNIKTVSYTYGDDLINQTRDGSTNTYHYDGLGSTRVLSDATGAITDSYNYEAFGETLNFTGTTVNNYLYAGEQFDSNLDQYYLRARYYDQGIGRFTQQDTWMGNNSDPITLHKYLYGNADPVNHTDPTGNFSLGSLGAAINTIGTLASIATTTIDIFQISTGEKEFSAREFGTSILLSRLPVKYVRNLLKRHKQKTGKNLKVACFRNSFTGDTKLHTFDGLVSIKDIIIGDSVLSFNEITKENEYQQVTHLIKGNKEYDLVRIITTEGELIEATSDHTFYINNDWIDAKDITLNDDLTLIDGKQSLASIETISRVESVFNISVNNTHTYYVSESGVLVHNEDDCVISVGNMGEFFETTFGVGIKGVSRKTSKRVQGQSVYKASKNSGSIQKGDQFYLDGLHKDHLEVFDKRGNFKTVLNLDGSVNHIKAANAASRILK